MFQPISLERRLILVTGASSGIGRATARLLDRLGARLILTARRAEALKETLAGISPRDHLSSTMDLTATDKISDWLNEQCGRAGGGLSGVVHCAGVGPRVPIRALSRKAMEEATVIHLYAALALIKAASARAVVAESGSSIVLLSSVAALSANPGLIVYGAVKGAVQAAARTAAAELAPKKIRVNCIAPAYVNTPMLASAREQLPGDFDQIVKRQALGWIEPDEVAMAAGYLLSDWARSITGTVLVMDGGYLL